MARNIFQAAFEMLDGGVNAAMVTIVSAEGFVPVSATSKLLVTSTGTLLGRSGSDVLDADIRAAAQRVLAQNPHSPRQFCVLNKDAVASGWYRAWTVELLIEPLQRSSPAFGQATPYNSLGSLVLEDRKTRGVSAYILRKLLAGGKGVPNASRIAF